ncbi:MAG: 3-deoxy-D-manno-octulosonic acid transferase [Gemmataceae bacterium]|nr:3-deoxy-D-manno-octulosonic acid transferase [Gemmataceae bacterium]
MRYLLDALYLLALLVAWPWLLLSKKRRGVWGRMRGDLPAGLPEGAVWFHGVSLGETNMLRGLVDAFRKRHPGQAVVVSSTTATGLEAARKHFGEPAVFPFPFDFSWACARVLGKLKPRLVVLGESELWPNFLGECYRRGVPVAVANGRMSPRSAGRYGWVRGLVRWMFGGLRVVGAQTAEHAAGFLATGARPGRVKVTGNIKYDGALVDKGNARTAALRAALGVEPGDRVFVAGSTQPGEEAAALAAFKALKGRHPRLKLFVVPRAPERFDEVAKLLGGERRSQGGRGDVVLIDTMGELGALWGLAEAAFVGGSLDGKRGGQSMIEPAAFGAAVLFGPHVWNFKETAARLLEVGGAVQVSDGAELAAALGRVLGDEQERRAMGAAARALVLAQQGATERTLDLLDEALGERERERLSGAA